MIPYSKPYNFRIERDETTIRLDATAHWEFCKFLIEWVALKCFGPSWDSPLELLSTFVERGDVLLALSACQDNMIISRLLTVCLKAVLINVFIPNWRYLAHACHLPHHVPIDLSQTYYLWRWKIRTNQAVRFVIWCCQIAAVFSIFNPGVVWKELQGVGVEKND